MPTQSPNPEWCELWEERGNAVRRVLGDTSPPGQVMSFAWKQFLLPGACAMTFAPNARRAAYLYMTLGLTQPVLRGDLTPGWEFAVETNEQSKWAAHILFDLLTYWLDQKRGITRGLRLPLAYFLNKNGELCAGLADSLDRLNVVGEIRGLYLWDDQESLRFKVSSGDFSLMIAVAVTEDEIQMGLETSPPHVLLLLKRMGIGQVSDPMRKSVMALPGAQAKWSRIRSLSHNKVISTLDGYRKGKNM